MQPKVFVSRDKIQRDQAIWKELAKFNIKQDNPEILILDDEKIGIAQVKQLIKHLSTKSFRNTPKSAVILNGNNISLDAQNALLKTLEEPSGESVILIGIEAENKLLPTILSRCQIINLSNSASHLSGGNVNIEDLTNSSLEDRFALIEKIADKEKFLEDFIFSYRKMLQNPDVSSYSTPRVKFLEELLQAQIWKASNVNIRTILEYLMLQLKSG